MADHHGVKYISSKSTDRETKVMKHRRTSNITPSHLQEFDLCCEYRNHRKAKGLSLEKM